MKLHKEAIEGPCFSTLSEKKRQLSVSQSFSKRVVGLFFFFFLWLFKFKNQAEKASEVLPESAAMKMGCWFLWCAVFSLQPP